ncbi:MAG TPA: PQQ-dependent catabolism-associated CXXCW motif protein [Rhizobiaceae bacterium]|nr:PQQ-dependent catabolism-associated CXXCW motif protein [Rhizobiaceae bacterium]
MLLLALGVLCGHAQAGDVAEPAGYRMEDYRAPVPATLEGATVVDTAQAEKLWRDRKAVFFDVMPHTPKPANLPAGTIWKDKVRKDIPGSTWLANVGYGAIPAETERYFRDGLSAKTGADPSKTILFYCMTDCWMSWNAAKRAMKLGYSSVLWYPYGSDGWEKAGLPLEENRPYIVER